MRCACCGKKSMYCCCYCCCWQWPKKHQSMNEITPSMRLSAQVQLRVEGNQALARATRQSIAQGLAGAWIWQVEQVCCECGFDRLVDHIGTAGFVRQTEAFWAMCLPRRRGCLCLGSSQGPAREPPRQQSTPTWLRQWMLGQRLLVLLLPTTRLLYKELPMKTLALHMPWISMCLKNHSLKGQCH